MVCVSYREVQLLQILGSRRWRVQRGSVSSLSSDSIGVLHLRILVGLPSLPALPLARIATKGRAAEALSSVAFQLAHHEASPGVLRGAGLVATARGPENRHPRALRRRLGARARAALRVGVSRPVSRAASIAPTACHARSVSAVLASHRRLGDAAARSRVASWATSHRRKSAISASASTADGSSSRERASSPDYGSHADAVHAFEDDSEDDSYEAFVASWRASLPTMEPNERAEAHRESCAEGRRRANEGSDENERCVRGRLSLSSVSSRFLLPRDRRRRVEHHPRCSLFLVIHQYWHQPDRLVPWGTPVAKKQFRSVGAEPRYEGSDDDARFSRPGRLSRRRNATLRSVDSTPRRLLDGLTLVNL